MPPAHVNSRKATTLNLSFRHRRELGARGLTRAIFFREWNIGTACPVGLDSAGEDFQTRKGRAFARVSPESAGSFLQALVGANDKAFDHIFLILAGGNAY